MVLIESLLEWVQGNTGRATMEAVGLLLVGWVGTTHQVIVASIAPFPTPDSPCDNRKTSEENRSANTHDNSDDGSLLLGAQPR